MAKLIVFIVFGVVLFLFFGQFVLPRILTYQVTERDIRVLLLGLIPIWGMKLEDVVEVREMRWRDWFRLGIREVLCGANMCNRFWGRRVRLKGKGGFFRCDLVISPDRPEEFVALCKQRLRELNNGNSQSDKTMVSEVPSNLS